MTHKGWSVIKPQHNKKKKKKKNMKTVLAKQLCLILVCSLFGWFQWEP